MPTDRARRLLVVGAAAGMGSWLCDHVFPALEWEAVYVVDTEESLKSLDTREWAFRCPVVQGFLTDATPDAPIRAVPRGLFDEKGTSHARAQVRAVAADPTVADDEWPGVSAPDLTSPGLTICFAVPRDALSTAAAALLPATDPAAPVAVVTHTMCESLRAIEPYADERRPVLGVHPLFEQNALSLDGQTLYLAGSHSAPDLDGFGWLEDAITGAGGIVKVGSAQRHDAVMSYVQGAAHQSLLVLAETIVTSGLDLHDDVWAARTPLFESLFGLAARVLEKRHQATIADIQVMLDGRRVNDELDAASARLRAAIDSGNRDAVGDHIAAVREHFGGTLFETVRSAATTAVSAAQSTRAELARCRRTGELVGIRLVGRDDMPRVGRIVQLEANEVTLRELLVGKRGAAALLEGTGEQNARRQGFNQKARETVFALGHVELIVGAELERELEDCLAHIRRDIRFLVPESVSGDGVLTAVAGTPGTHGGEVVSEAVRTGQRAVVIRLGIRIDQNVDQMTEALRRRVDASYAWPKGLARPAAKTGQDVGYLGPPGTFSEIAAMQGAQTAGLSEPTLTARDSFDQVLAGVANGSLAVLPVSSSSSGLVSRAVTALLAYPGELAAGGVVDVAVRLDAYVRADAELVHGAVLHSHPQVLAQCANFIRRWGLRAAPCASTTDALRLLAASTGPAVALAGEGKETAVAGLKVAEREVDDLSGSITRFLIVGGAGSFGEFTGGSDPTVRSILVSDSVEQVTAAIRRDTAGAAFDEILTDAAGRCLWVTSRVLRPGAPQAGEGGAVPGKYLGRAPWSPRTPVVRVEADAQR